jgi:hypothetical protein
MRLLLGDSRFRQVINDRLGLDLQLSGQFIDSDLFDFAHSSRGYSSLFDSEGVSVFSGLAEGLEGDSTAGALSLEAAAA